MDHENKSEEHKADEINDREIDGTHSGDSPGKEIGGQSIVEEDGWYEIRLLGKLPERRSYHSCSVANNQ
jgi:hypothetical protein